MGDRYYSFEKCPKCGEMYELYDAPSSLMYIGNCEGCGWSEPKTYYELSLHEIALFSPEELSAWEKETGKKALNTMSDKEFTAWYKKNKDNE